MKRTIVIPAKVLTPPKAVAGILLLILFSFFYVPIAAFAAEVFFPVHDTSLSYDATQGILHVKAQHPSQNFSVDYVRMMTVSVNGQQVLTKNYSHQDSGDGFSDDVKVQAKAGDVISVEVFATGGNSDTQSLTVTDNTDNTTNNQ